MKTFVVGFICPNRQVPLTIKEVREGKGGGGGGGGSKLMKGIESSLKLFGISSSCEPAKSNF